MGRNFPVNEDAGWTLVEGNLHPHHNRGNHGYRKHDNYKKERKHQTETSEPTQGEAKQPREEREKKVEKPQPQPQPQPPAKTIDIQQRPEVKKPVEPKPVKETKPQ